MIVGGNPQDKLRPFASGGWRQYDARPCREAPMDITPDLVDHVAALSRLKIPAGEKGKFLDQFRQILAVTEKISALQTDGIEPLVHVHESANAFREDTPRPCLPAEEALRLAPDRSGPFFKVPKVIGG